VLILKKLTKKELNKRSKKKGNKSDIDKILKVNNLSKEQLDDLMKKYDLTEIEISNLEKMKEHYDNLNELFIKFKK